MSEEVKDPVVSEEDTTETTPPASNVIPMPTREENETAETEEEQAPQAINPEDPLDAVSMRNIQMMLSNGATMVQTMESIWNADKQEYGVTDTHMKLLYQWNEEHRTPMPEGLSEEEQNEFDHFNGLDSITEEKIVEIFGEGHKIIGIEHSITLDRVKTVVNDFFSYLSCMREYQEIHDAYLQLLEHEEDKNIGKLQDIIEKEEDPEKKAKLQANIDLYYNRKYLDFLKDPMKEIDIDRIVKAFYDSKKVEYWLNRTREKMKQLKISSKFILEISQFEKRFLEEKYHKCSNILLLYFMQTIIYSDLGNKKNDGRTRSVCMIFALDGCIRNTWAPELKERVLDNVRGLLDQFVDRIPDPETKTETTETE